MIEVLPSPANVLAYRVTGTIDGSDYDRMVEALDDKLKDHSHIGVVADMTGFTDMTGEAILKDLRFHLSRLGEWSRFPRAAVVTDKAWLKGLVTTLDPIFPQFEARSFDPGHDAEAIAWAADLPAAKA